MNNVTDVPTKLNAAVDGSDVEASLRMLRDAGGPCQARDLAQQASAKGFVKYSVIEHLDTETLTLYKTYLHSSTPVAGITQPRCKR